MLRQTLLFLFFFLLSTLLVQKTQCANAYIKMVHYQYTYGFKMAKKNYLKYFVINKVMPIIAFKNLANKNKNVPDMANPGNKQIENAFKIESNLGNKQIENAFKIDSNLGNKQIENAFKIESNRPNQMNIQREEFNGKNQPNVIHLGKDRDFFNNNATPNMQFDDRFNVNKNHPTQMKFGNNFDEQFNNFAKIHFGKDFNMDNHPSNMQYANQYQRNDIKPTNMNPQKDFNQFYNRPVNFDNRYQANNYQPINKDFRNVIDMPNNRYGNMNNENRYNPKQNQPIQMKMDNFADFEKIKALLEQNNRPTNQIKPINQKDFFQSENSKYKPMPSIKKKEVKRKPTNTNKNTSNNSNWEEEVNRYGLKFLNEFRVKNNRSVLKWDEQVFKVTRPHTQAMVLRSKISHDGFNGRADQLGKFFFVMQSAENVAYFSTYEKMSARSIAEKLNNQWINSAGHRRNMLLPDINYAAVSILKNENTGAYYGTQFFIRK